MPLSDSLIIPAISLIPSGGICMLCACIYGPSVLGSFNHTEWQQHGLWRLWHTAVGCQICGAGYACYKNETSNRTTSRKSENDVSLLLCNYFLHCLLVTFLEIVKLVVGSRLKMLLELYEFTSEAQRMKVVRWAKQQITENYFNCTMRPPSDSRLSKKLVELINSETTFYNKIQSRILLCSP